MLYGIQGNLNTIKLIKTDQQKAATSFKPSFTSNNDLFICAKQISKKQAKPILKRLLQIKKQMQKAVEDFTKKTELPAFKELGITNLKWEPHAIQRVFERVKNGRIKNNRAIVDALKNGTVYNQKNFDGDIILGKNGVVLVLDKGKEKGQRIVSSVYESKEPFTTWTKKLDYNI